MKANLQMNYDVKMNEGEGQTIKPVLAEVNLQDIIRERKAERKLNAELKRQVDLQRIRDMKSSTGIDPLQRFPKEIWMQILNELDPEDRGNVWRVHPLFRDLMKGTCIAEILLPQALRIDTFRNNPCFFLGTKRDEQLRSICKTTRESFDRWIEDRLNTRIQENEHRADFSDFNYDNEIIDIFPGCKRPTLKQLMASYNEGENCGGKFFPKVLAISFSGNGWDGQAVPENYDKFKADVTALLKRIGDQIWHFKFLLENLTTADLSFTDVYILFQGWISLMPNLKWLEIMIRPKYQMIDEGKGEEMMSLAQSALQNYPFPRLSHLERLGFRSCYRQGKMGSFHNIYEVVLAANQHIKSLDLNLDEEDCDVDKDTSTDPDLILLPPHLTQSLELRRFNVCDEYFNCGQTLMYTKRIIPTVNFSWPLQTIILALSNENKDDSISSVFRFLERFQTLEIVKLKRMESFRIGDTEKKIGYLALPNLKVYEMGLDLPQIDYESNIHFFFSLQFLLHCDRLEKITWTLIDFDVWRLRKQLKKFERENWGKMIEFRAGLRYMHDSNIWDIFPALESLHVSIRKDVNTFTEFCEQEYNRADVESMTARQFLKSHTCIPSSIDSCVM